MANIIQNPGFETGSGSTPDSWTFSAGTYGVLPTWDTIGYLGRSLKWVANQLNAIAEQTVSSVQPSTIYYLSAIGKSTGKTIGVGRIRCIEENSAGTGVQTTILDFDFTDTNWTKKTMQFKTTATTSKIRITTTATGDGSFNLDNMSLDTSPENLLANPGFETGDVGNSYPLSWGRVALANGALKGVAPTWETGFSNTGARSMKFTSLAGVGGYIEQVTFVMPSTAYEISCFVKMSGVTGSGVKISVNEYDATGIWLTKSDFLLGSGTYEYQKKISTLTTMSTTTRINFSVIFTGGDGTMWIDDLYLGAPTSIVTCPDLSANLTLSPTTTQQGSVIATSTAVGGTPTGDGMKHRIYESISGSLISETGVGYARVATITFSTSGWLSGTYQIVSEITDGCLPVHKVATSPPIALTITSACPQLVSKIDMTT